MKKRTLSGLVAASILTSCITSISAFSAEEFAVTAIERLANSEFLITFNKEVDAQTLDGIALTSDGKRILSNDIEVKVQETEACKVSVEVKDVDITLEEKSYILRIPGSVGGIDYDTLGENEYYKFTVYGDTEDFSDTSDWNAKILGTQTDIKTQDGRLLLTDTVAEDGTVNYPSNTFKAFPVDYNVTVADEEVYEYDYYQYDGQMNTSPQKRIRSFMFRGRGIDTVSGTNSPRYYYGYSLCMRYNSSFFLRRHENSYTFGDGTQSDVCKVISYGDTYEDVLTKPVRIRIKVKNNYTNDEITSVSIDVYAAAYNEGVLGEYTKIISYVDDMTLLTNAETIAACTAGREYGFRAASGEANRYWVDNVIKCHAADCEKVEITVANPLEVTSVERISDTEFKITFNDSVDETTVSEITVSDSNTEYMTEINVTDNVVNINVKNIPLTSEASVYTIKLPRDITSTAGYKLVSSMVYSFTMNGEANDFSSANGWKIYSSENDKNDAVINNGQMYLTNQPCGEDGSLTAPTKQVVVAPTSYGTAYSHEVYEFDYESVSGDVSNNQQFAFMFRGNRARDRVNDNVPRYYKGLYFTIRQGRNLVLRVNTSEGLLKFSGEALKSCSTLPVEGRLRLKTEVNNNYTGEEVESIDIKISYAVYTDGILGEYTTAIDYNYDISAVDDAVKDTLIGGTDYAFRASNTDDNVNKYIIDNFKRYELSEVKKVTTNIDYITEKFADKEEIVIATIGGSQTALGLWQPYIVDYYENITGKTVKLVNAGVGGTGSDFGNIRLYDDVLKYNPDVVYIDFNGNDDVMSAEAHNIQGYSISAANIDSILQRLVKLETNPIISMWAWPSNDLVKKVLNEDSAKLLMDKTYKDICKYYGISYVDYNEWLCDFASLDADGNVVIDYGSEEVPNALTPYVYDYLNNTGDTMLDAGKNEHNIKDYVNNGNFKALALDNVHMNQIGAKILSDLMINSIENDLTTLYTDINYNAKPFMGRDYGRFNAKRVDFTKEYVENNGQFELDEGLVLTDASNGLQVANPTQDTAHMIINFKGHVFKLNTAATKDPATSDVTEAAVSAIIDGMWNYHYISAGGKSLFNKTEHSCDITIPANSVITLDGMYVDEENLLLDNEAVGDKWVTVDISYDTNRNGIGTVGEPSAEGPTKDYIRIEKDNLLSQLKDGKLTSASGTVFDLSSINNKNSHVVLIKDIDKGNYGYSENTNTIRLGGVYAEEIRLLTLDPSYPLVSGTDEYVELPFTVHYTDGTVSEMILKPNNSVEGGAEFIGNAATVETVKPDGTKGSNMNLNEYKLSVDSTKRVEKISVYIQEGSINRYGLSILGVTLKTKDSAGIYDMEIKGADNKLITSVESVSGQTVTADYSLYLNCIDGETADVIAAVYDENGILVVCKKQSITLSENYTKITQDIELPQNLSGKYTIKTFMLDSTATMIPLSGVYIVEK